jgi:hypothetical protein
MQGVIIVPSRAAYARDNSIYGTVYANRSFVFNFQLYNTKTRVKPGKINPQYHTKKKRGSNLNHAFI